MDVYVCICVSSFTAATYLVELPKVVIPKRVERAPQRLMAKLELNGLKIIGLWRNVGLLELNLVKKY